MLFDIYIFANISKIATIFPQNFKMVRPFWYFGVVNLVWNIDEIFCAATIGLILGVRNIRRAPNISLSCILLKIIYIFFLLVPNSAVADWHNC